MINPMDTIEYNGTYISFKAWKIHTIKILKKENPKATIGEIGKMFHKIKMKSKEYKALSKIVDDDISEQKKGEIKK